MASACIKSDTFVATVKPIRFDFISAESPKCRLMSRHGSIDLGPSYIPRKSIFYEFLCCFRIRQVSINCYTVKTKLKIPQRIVSKW